MTVLEEHIIRINKKMQQLLKQYQQLQKTNNHQATIIQQLKDQKETDNNTIQTLQQQVTILKTATGQMDDNAKKEFEKIINLHLKEIDKCINLLSE